MANWIETETGHRCELHKKDFDFGEVCRACASERRATIEAQQDSQNLAASVDLDTEMSLEADSALSYCKFLHGRAEKRIADGNPNDWNAAAKLIAEGTKLQRFALDVKEKLSARAHSRYLVEHEKDIRGLRRKGN